MKKNEYLYPEAYYFNVLSFMRGSNTKGLMVFLAFINDILCTFRGRYNPITD